MLNCLQIYKLDDIGNLYSTTSNIDLNQELHESERWYGSNGFKYTFTLDSGPGTYTVNLYFAEIFWDNTNARTFDIIINDVTYYTSLDILSEAGGKYKELIKSFDIAITTTNILEIYFAKTATSINNPKCSAIEILATTSPTINPTPNPTGNPTGNPTRNPTTPPVASSSPLPGVELYINCGVDSSVTYVDSSGNIWISDIGYANVNGNDYITSDNIANTVDDTIFQSERWYSGNILYSFNVDNGFYDVTLYFAEIYFNAADAREFDVEIEGILELSNLDLFAIAGHDSAVEYTFTNDEVIDSVLNINLIQKFENPKISGLKIISTTVSNPVPNPTPNLTVSPVHLLSIHFLLQQQTVILSHFM